MIEELYLGVCNKCKKHAKLFCCQLYLCKQHLKEHRLNSFLHIRANLKRNGYKEDSNGILKLEIKKEI